MARPKKQKVEEKQEDIATEEAQEEIVAEEAPEEEVREEGQAQEQEIAEEQEIPEEETPKWAKKLLEDQEKRHKRQMEDMQTAYSQQFADPYANYQVPEAMAQIDPKKEELRKALLELQQEEQIKAQKAFEAERSKEFVETVTRARDKYENFDELVYHDKGMPEALIKEAMFSPVGPDVLYYLKTKGAETYEKIRKMHPKDQQREFIKIEAKLEAEQQNSNISKAPAPIEPVKGQRAGGYNADNDTSLEGLRKRLRPRRR